MIRSILLRPAVLTLCLAAAAPAAGLAQAPDPGGAPAPRADAELAFTRGVIAFQDGDYAAARARFEEAVRLDPDDGTAHYWLGLALLNLDEPAAAARALRESLGAERPPAVDRSEVRSRLADAERRAGGEAGGAAPVPAPGWGGDFEVLGEVPRFEGRLYLAAGSDSNPNLMPPDLVLGTPDGDPVEGEQSDAVLLADARLAFQRASGGPAGEGGGSARTWGLVLRGHQALHDEFDYLDLGHLEVVGHLALGADPLGYLTGPFGYARVPFGRSPVAFLAQVGASKDWLDGEGYADRLVGGASLAVNEGAWGQTRVSASYQDVDFDDDPGPALDDLLGRSGERLDGELAQYLFFGRRNRYLRLAVGAGERDAGAAYDSSSEEASAEASLPLAGRWTLYLSGALRNDDYDEPVSNLFFPTGEPRQDDETRLGASLVFRAFERLFVSGRVTWIDHEIDLPGGFATPDLSYERTIATLGVAWVF
jgi:hypothetical protein